MSSEAVKLILFIFRLKHIILNKSTISVKIDPIKREVASSKTKKGPLATSSSFGKFRRSSPHTSLK